LGLQGQLIDPFLQLGATLFEAAVLRTQQAHQLGEPLKG
jgi:hypothetical protein